MKRMLLTLMITIMAMPLWAQAPDAFQYQAVVRDGDGNIRSNENVEITINLLQDAADGTEIFSETHSTSTNEHGLINLLIGEGDGTDDISTVDWAAGPYFIEVVIDGTAMGASQLLSVPYAKHASTASTVVGESQNLEHVLTQGSSAGNMRIEDLAAPENQQDATNKAYVDALLNRLNMLEDMLGVDTLHDSQGNIYKTVRIGNQVWMAEGLRATKYADGTDITEVYWYQYDINDDGTVDAQDSTYYANNYGLIYSAEAAMNGAASSNNNPSGVQGACPTGWHLPSNAEWLELRDTLGGYDIAGAKMKDTDMEYWDAPTNGINNKGATNESGFSARGTGNRHNGNFYQIDYIAYFWSATESSSTEQYAYRVYSDETILNAYPMAKSDGSTIRCVKDQ